MQFGSGEHRLADGTAPGARLSAFALAAGPRLQSIDLNPVFAMLEGHGAFAADAAVEVGD
jgi:hypothetical protein